MPSQLELPARFVDPPKAEVGTAGLGQRWVGFTLLAIVAVYLWLGCSDYTRWGPADPANEKYNLLIEGFKSGHLSLIQPAPAELAALPDPYDPEANLRFRLSPYGLHDVSYFRGHLYLYFSAVPAIIAFLPWEMITDRPLPERLAVAVFCSLALILEVYLVEDLRRRCFPKVPVTFQVAATFALGLASGVPAFLQRAGMWEVPVACGWFCLVGMLVALWKSYFANGHTSRWLMLAGSAYALAVASRPSLVLSGAAFIPSIIGRRQSRRSNLALVIPIMTIGAAAIAYNAARFGNPWEFGQRYQMAGDRQDAGGHFRFGYVGYNLWTYFLEFPGLENGRPFVSLDRTAEPVPSGHAHSEDTFGVLVCLPFLWLGLGVPLASRWRNQSNPHPAVQRFVLSIAAAAIGPAIVLCAFYGTCLRYEMEFIPALSLLAVVGAYTLDDAHREKPAERRVFRGLALGLLGVSFGFTVLASLAKFVEERREIGRAMLVAGQTEGAKRELQRAIAVRPADAQSHDLLGISSLMEKRPTDATQSFLTASLLAPAERKYRDHLSFGMNLLKEQRAQPSGTAGKP